MIDKAKTDFKYAQKIKRVGFHLYAGHRADFYINYLGRDGEAIELYIEETRQRADWKDNFDFILVKGSNGKWYHRGFYINAMIIKDKLESMSYESLTIYSYSQGAAVAQILSDFIHVDSLITFGCPNNVLFNKAIKTGRANHIHYIQGFDIVAYGIFWLKRYGEVRKLPSLGNPFKDHNYWWLLD